MMNAGLSGLPPLPKSLSGLLNPEEDSVPSFSSPGPHHASAFRPIAQPQPQQTVYANTRPRSRERSSSSTSSASNLYINTQEARSAAASSHSPGGGRKWTNLDSQLSLLRQADMLAMFYDGQWSETRMEQKL